MGIKLFDSEISVMEIIWENGDMRAADIAKKLEISKGWSTTTTYTIIKKCVQKGAIERRKPKFICHPLISKEAMQTYETREFIDRIFAGKPDQLMASLVGNNVLDSNDIKRLKDMINNMDSEQGV